MQDLEEHIGQEKWYVEHHNFVRSLYKADVRSVVFSFWTSTLEVVEDCLKSRSIGYMRFDGKVPNKQRGILLKSFKNDPDVRVALMTISCGAVG